MQKHERKNCAHKMELPDDFAGLWIPSGIWLSRSFSSWDKVILSLILQSDHDGRGSAETNRYFAKICGRSPQTISRRIVSLVKRGYLSSTIERNNSRRLTIVNHHHTNL